MFLYSENLSNTRTSKYYERRVDVINDYEKLLVIQTNITL